MSAVSILLSDEDEQVLRDLEKARGVTGEAILAGIAHDFLHHQARKGRQARDGLAGAGPGEFASEADIADHCAAMRSPLSWGRTRT